MKKTRKLKKFSDGGSSLYDQMSKEQGRFGGQLNTEAAQEIAKFVRGESGKPSSIPQARNDSEVVIARRPEKADIARYSPEPVSRQSQMPEGSSKNAEAAVSDMVRSTANRMADQEIKNHIQDAASKAKPMSDIFGTSLKKGGAVKKMASGGSVSASRRGDGIAQRGKTKGRMI